MDEPIEVVFTYSRDEYVRAMKRYYQAALRAKRDVIGGVIAVAVGLYMLQMSYGGWLGWLLVGSGLFLLAIVAYAFIVMPKNNLQVSAKAERRISTDLFGNWNQVRYQWNRRQA